MRKTIRRLLVGLGVVLLASGALWARERMMDAYLIRPIEGTLQAVLPDTAYSVGAFEVGWDAVESQLYIVSQVNPGRRIWETVSSAPFVAAARGHETISDSRAHYTIVDDRQIVCAVQTVDAIERVQDTVQVSGSLGCDDDRTVSYWLVFASADAQSVHFELTTDDPELNRLFLTDASDPDEHIMGFGEQFSYFDMKGRRLPVYVQEQGIGRGAEPITTGANLQAGAGGTWYASYAAVPHYLTSHNRSLFLENYEYAVFDMRAPDRIQMEAFSHQMAGRILYGNSPTELIEAYTGLIGRMPALPDWIIDGAVVGMQGGTQRVREVYDQLRARDVPIAAFWLQDWVGWRQTSFGSQLWWNWELDSAQYPGWDALRADLAADDVALMIYFNPYLVDVSDKPDVKRNLYREAIDQGYVVRTASGDPYLLPNSDFSSAIVDLTNPDAAAWLEEVIREQVVDNGVRGWMADFGEGLPYDGLYASGTDGAIEHNRFPERWSQANADVARSLDDSVAPVYFMRAGYRGSPPTTRLFWLGDQLVSWDAQDGIKTAVTGLLTSGLSGFSFNHSDIGGYTTITNPLRNYHRSPELLMRWMELNAFTVVFRTHEGNQPGNNAQFYDDETTLAQFARMAKLYAAWGFYRRQLVAEAAQTGMPVVRPLFVHYPDDEKVYAITYEQFLVGSELLVAPVLDPDTTQIEVYLPEGTWVHLWTGDHFASDDGQTVTVAAPMGQPAVFYRADSEVGMQFAANVRAAGLLD